MTGRKLAVSRASSQSVPKADLYMHATQHAQRQPRFGSSQSARKEAAPGSNLARPRKFGEVP
jgi:hypothetical protein